MATPSAESTAEPADKDRVIAHLTKTLAHTRECLEKARAALDSIANDEAMSYERCRETALAALEQI